jgi:hypothetical protein
MDNGTVNYLAVLVAGVVGFMPGALWYSPVMFGKQWQAMTGISDEAAKAMGKAPFLISAIGGLLLAYGIARVMNLAGLSGLQGGVMIAALVWLLFLAPLMLSQTLYQGRPVKLWWIDVGYRFISTMIVGVILGVWS